MDIYSILTQSLHKPDNMFYFFLHTINFTRLLLPIIPMSLAI